MNVLFDSCLWIDELRRGILRPLLPLVRRRHLLWMDSVAAGEVLAGLSDRKGRRDFRRFLEPFERSGRIVTPVHPGFLRAADALARLRGEGIGLRNPKSALLDALQAADAVRIGALLVTHNLADFSRLAAYIPCRVESFESFRRSLWSDSPS